MKIFKQITVFVFVFTLAGAYSAYAKMSPQTEIFKADRALESNPHDAKAYYNRGTAHYNLGEYDAAVSDLTKSISFEPKAADAYFNRGLSLRQQKKLNETIADFSKAIELHPKQSFSYYYERCNARIANNDFAGAIADGDEVIRLSPKDAEGYFLRGLAHYLKGDLDAGLEDAGKALEFHPGHPNAERLKTEILEKKKSS